MATSTVQILTDDIDGADVQPGHGQTVYFSFQGNDYTIDLSDKNYEKFAAEIGVWASKAYQPGAPAGRRRARTRARAGTRPPRSNAETVAPVAIRALRLWARDNGYPVSARGPLPGQVQQAYAAAH